MGGLFPTSFTLSRIHTVLDIGCGPGGWAQNVAATYPDMHVVGIDISPQMLKFARLTAGLRGVSNVRFFEMDARQPLRFPDASFDCINARFIQSFMLRDHWPVLVGECKRLLRPGGILRLTELEHGTCNSHAVERLNELFSLAMYASGHNFTATRRELGAAAILERFLTEAGFIDIEQQFFECDNSYGTAFAQDWKEDYIVLYHMVMPFMVKTGVTSQEHMEILYQQALSDMNAHTFISMVSFRSAWGIKPTE